MKRLALLLLLAGCAHKVPVQPPESFAAMLFRTEGVHCADITAHDEQSPVPDCRRIYDAWLLGRARVVKVYPQAAAVTMAQVWFYRPKLYWVTEKPYPLISLSGDGMNLVRGVTSPAGPVQISFSYPEVIQHEATHAIIRIVDGGKLRTPEAINAPQDADQSGATLLFQVSCHSTSDDVFGDGPPGNRASCAGVYAGP